jgi:hypothetical protein
MSNYLLLDRFISLFRIAPKQANNKTKIEQITKLGLIDENI